MEGETDVVLVCVGGGGGGGVLMLLGQLGNMENRLSLNPDRLIASILLLLHSRVVEL